MQNNRGGAEYPIQLYSFVVTLHYATINLYFSPPLLRYGKPVFLRAATPLRQNP